MTDINQKIAELCDTPDPIKMTQAQIFAALGVPELFYAESLIETLREAIEDRDDALGDIYSTVDSVMRWIQYKKSSADVGASADGEVD